MMKDLPSSQSDSVYNICGACLVFSRGKHQRPQTSEASERVFAAFSAMLKLTRCFTSLLDVPQCPTQPHQATDMCCVSSENNGKHLHRKQVEVSGNQQWRKAPTNVFQLFLWQLTETSITDCILIWNLTDICFKIMRKWDEDEKMSCTKAVDSEETTKTHSVFTSLSRTFLCYSA